jgi:hypothetical protein
VAAVVLGAQLLHRQEPAPRAPLATLQLERDAAGFGARAAALEAKRR